MGQGRNSKISQVFDSLDLDKSGSIEKWELLHWIKNEQFFQRADAWEKANDLMKQIDTSGDQHIQKEELAKFFETWTDEQLTRATSDLLKRGKSMRKKGATPEKIKEIKRELSTLPSKTELLIKFFYRLDLDRNGQVSQQELSNWLQQEDAFKTEDIKKKAQDLMSKMDKDGDKKVTYTEICEYFKGWTLEDIMAITQNFLSKPPRRISDVHGGGDTKGSPPQKVTVLQVVFPEKYGGFLTVKCTKLTDVKSLKEALIQKVTKRRVLAKVRKTHDLRLTDFGVSLEPQERSLEDNAPLLPDEANVLKEVADAKQQPPYKLYLVASTEEAESYILGIGKTRFSRWVIRETDPIEHHYDLGNRLGTPGQFGYALLVTGKKTHRVCATKVVSKTSFHNVSEKKIYFEQLRREIEVMKQMDHPNIIKFQDVFESASQIYIVMELCAGGELFDRIKEKERYNEKDAALVLREMFEAVKYLHDKKIVHCDLKPDNFLFSTKDEKAPLKLIDFGMSKYVERRKYFSTLCGTSYYIAPEVIEGHYAESCDIWSLGVVMFIMLFGYPPFYANPAKYGTNTNRKIFSLIKRGFNPITAPGYGAWFNEDVPVSDSAKNLISKLLTLDTAKRITAAEALEHSWLRGETAEEKPLAVSVLRALKEFSGTNRFKQAVLMVMVDVMDDDELEKLQKTFKALDTDGDGTLTVTELSKAIKDIHPKELSTLISKADLNGDGSLSYQELLMTSVQRKILNKEERLWQAFCRIDKDGNGVISKEELEECLGKDKDLIAEILAKVDIDGDGLVDYEEFLAMWENDQRTIAKTGSFSLSEMPLREEDFLSDLDKDTSDNKDKSKS